MPIGYPYINDNVSTIKISVPEFMSSLWIYTPPLLDFYHSYNVKNFPVNLKIRTANAHFYWHKYPSPPYAVGDLPEPHNSLEKGIFHHCIRYWDKQLALIYRLCYKFQSTLEIIYSYMIVNPIIYPTTCNISAFGCLQ